MALCHGAKTNRIKGERQRQHLSEKRLSASTDYFDDTGRLGCTELIQSTPTSIQECLWACGGICPFRVVLPHGQDPRLSSTSFPTPVPQSFTQLW